MNEMKNKPNIGSNIALLRRQKGLTQTHLAELLYVSNKTVSKWERGGGYPEITQLATLARVLGTTVDRLIMGERYGIAIAGNVLTDIVKMIDAYPQKGMLSNILSLSTAVGGCVPNTGIDLTKIDRGLAVWALGRIGNDAGGKYVLAQMQQSGMDVSQIVTSKTSPTGFSDVMSIASTGERTFFHHRGANAEFSPADINLSLLNCKMLHIGYILLLDSFDQANSEYGTVMARFLKSVQDAGILTSIDMVSDSDGHFAEKVIPALKYTDNAFMNEIEGGEVTGICARDADGRLVIEQVHRIMQSILSMGVRQRVILHAPEAGFCLEADGTFTVIPSIKLEKGFIKGSVGAGDAFCAGCLYGIYNDFDAKRMLEFASGAACCNLSAEDSVSGMRDKEYIKKFISEHERLEIGKDGRI